MPNKEKYAYMHTCPCILLPHVVTYPLNSLLIFLEQFCHPLPNELDHCAVLVSFKGYHWQKKVHRLYRLYSWLVYSSFLKQPAAEVFLKAMNNWWFAAVSLCVCAISLSFSDFLPNFLAKWFKQICNSRLVLSLTAVIKIQKHLHHKSCRISDLNLQDAP